MNLKSMEVCGNEVRIKLDHQYTMDKEKLELQIRTTTQWLQILLKAKEMMENENPRHNYTK